MADKLIEHEGVKYKFTDSGNGAALDWEWEGCGGTLWFSNDELKALAEWIGQREPQPQLGQGKS